MTVNKDQPVDVASGKDYIATFYMIPKSGMENLVVRDLTKEQAVHLMNKVCTSQTGRIQATQLDVINVEFLVILKVTKK